MKHNNNLIIFIFLSILIILLTTLSKNILNFEEILANSLSYQLTKEQIYDILNLRDEWKWIEYVTTPILLLIKISIISAVLDAGCFFFEKEIKYKKLFNIVLKAEFVFLLVIIFKTIWFYFFKTNYVLEDIQNFFPFSLLNIIGYKDLETWFIYPFQVINLFEAVYWLVLAFLIGKEINDTTKKGLSIVASSYGIGLLIWVVGVMFFTLNMN